MLLDDGVFFKWKKDSRALMQEDCLYLGSCATFCHGLLAHVWLGLVFAMVRRTWCPVVSPLAALLPLSPQVCAQKKGPKRSTAISYMAKIKRKSSRFISEAF